MGECFGFQSGGGGGTSGGTVTSVGISMPDAFDVNNSPITESGTIEVTANGDSSQYIRGDGTLGTFPQQGGAGGGTVYYLNGNTSQGVISGRTMYELSKEAKTGVSANFTRNSNGLLASFITDLNEPNQLNIPVGIWIFQCYLSEAGGGANHAEIQASIQKYDGATLTTISTGIVEQITNGNVKDLYQFGVTIPSGTTLTLTDRIVVNLTVSNDNGKAITLYTEGNNLSSVVTTFADGISSLNGLTETAQTFQVGTSGNDFEIISSTSIHTFNLPTASATKRGALSSTDWNIFNGKQNELGFTPPPNTRQINTNSPLSGGGDLTANRTLSIAQSSASTDGYLSSTDWNTFNSKASYTPRVQSVISSSSVTPTATNDEVVITAQAVSLTLENPTGSPVQGQSIMIRIKDSGVAQAIAYGTQYRAIGVTLPTITTANKTLYIGMIYNSTDTKWDILGINQEA
jgi:hypothetical protein